MTAASHFGIPFNADGMLTVPAELTSDHRLVFYRLVSIEAALTRRVKSGQAPSTAARRVWRGNSSNSAW